MLHQLPAAAQGNPRLELLQPGTVQMGTSARAALPSRKTLYDSVPPALPLCTGHFPNPPRPGWRPGDVRSPSFFITLSGPTRGSVLLISCVTVTELLNLSEPVPSRRKGD